MESFILMKILQVSSSDTDSSDSSSSDEFLVSKEHVKKARIETYVDCVVPKYSDRDFQSHFRLTRTAFENLLITIKAQKPHTRKPIFHKEALLLTLWTLANQESFRGIADRFGMTKGEAHKMCINVCKTLYTLQDDYIIWPKDNAAAITVEKYNELRGPGSFPNVLGCVDGCHIAIPGPRQDNSYYNRKGFNSMLLQGICNSQLEFINIFCGWPGSSHDARMWTNSPIYDRLNRNIGEYMPDNCHLLGDSAYPLRTFIMVPFRDNGHLSPAQRKFNKLLSSKRVVIEQAFGRLKGTFPRLKYLHVTNLQHAKFIVVAACILHNICIHENIVSEDYTETFDNPNDNDDALEVPHDDVQANEKRLEIMTTPMHT